MPRVPNYQPGQVGPVQTTQARFRAPDNPGGLGLLAEGLAGVANIANTADKIELENDETQARTALAQARTQYATALDQFKGLKLGQARAGQQEFNSTLDKIKADLVKSGTSPRMRMMIEQGLIDANSEYRRMGASHAFGEAQSETKASFGFEQSALIESAVASDNPAFRDRSGLQLRDSVRRQLEFEGITQETMPDAYVVAEKAAMSKLHSGVLDRMFASPDPDIDQVGQYLTAYRDELTSDLYTKTLERMQGPLQERIDDARADLVQPAPKVGDGPVGAPPGPWQGVAVSVAQRFGLDPSDVAAVMSYETGGTFSPTIMGGKNGQYMGLIQFGPSERKKYGIDKASTPEDWTEAVGDFLQDRGFKKGMGMLDLYSTINAGQPGRYNASDGNGTVRSHVEQILGSHKEKAKGWLGGAASYDNAPREWDKAEVFDKIEQKASAEGWTPEATKRVKNVWARRMSTDEGLLNEQRRSADDEAKVIALRSGDNFKVSMLPKAVRDTLSPVDLAGYQAAETRIAEARTKEAREQTGKAAEWQLEAQARFDPEGFKGVDLKKYIGVIGGETLNSLAMKQAELARKPRESYSEVNYRSSITSEIEFQEKHNGIKLSDAEKVNMFDYMSGMLSQVQAKRGAPLTKQDVSTMFQSGYREIAGTGGLFGGDKRQFEVLTDIPDDFKSRFLTSWKGRAPPTNGQMVSAYQQWVVSGR